MVNLSNVNPDWIPPENRPNAMEEWGGMTPEFRVHDMATSPGIVKIRQDLKEIATQLVEKYNLRSKLCCSYDVPYQSYVLSLVVWKHIEDDPYELSAMIEDAVVVQGQRDVLVQWVQEFLDQLNNWLQQEGLQLPGSELLLEEGDDDDA